MNLLIKVLHKLKHIFFPDDATTTAYPYIHLEKGNIQFHINNSIEEFRLKRWGGEKEYVQQMLSDLRPDDTFYDIGSSVGLISIFAAQRLTKGKVISFEPDPENARKLEANYQINNLKNFDIQALAVGEDTGRMDLYTSGSNGFSPSLQKVNGIDHTIKVDIESIDNLIKNKIIPYPTVVKIDIEGAEMMALKGMKNLLNSDHKPRLLFIELHPDFLPSFGTSTDEIFAFLADLDYTMVENIVRDKQVLCKLISK